MAKAHPEAIAAIGVEVEKHAAGLVRAPTQLEETVKLDPDDPNKPLVAPSGGGRR